MLESPLARSQSVKFEAGQDTEEKYSRVRLLRQVKPVSSAVVNHNANQRQRQSAAGVAINGTIVSWGKEHHTSARAATLASVNAHKSLFTLTFMDQYHLILSYVVI